MGKTMNIDWENMELLYIMEDECGSIREVSQYEYHELEEYGDFSEIYERIDPMNNRWVHYLRR